MTSLFDTPLRKGRDTVAPRETGDPRGAIRCSTYSAFMVKEIDYGDHGADAILVKFREDEAPVLCGIATDAEERLLSGSAESYFLGAKGRFGFVVSTSAQAGTPFTIHDLTRSNADPLDEILFSSTLATATVPSRLSLADGALRLDYVSSVRGRCSVVTGGSACWNDIVSESGPATGLENAATPIGVCKSGYATAQSESGSAADVPSVVTYTTHLTIDTNNNITVEAGPIIACAPQA